MTVDDNKRVAVFDAQSLALLQQVPLGSYGHSLHLVQGKVMVSCFDGSLIDIHKLNQRNVAASLVKVQSLDTCSPIYCVTIIEKRGLLLAGQIDGFVNIIEVKEYRSLY